MIEPIHYLWLILIHLLGFNEDVLKNLIKFYLMKPVEPNYELRPYLSPERYISNTADAKKRTTIDKNFKYLMSNRPRHLLADELLHWEKIYKVWMVYLYHRHSFFFLLLLTLFVCVCVW